MIDIVFQGYNPCPHMGVIESITLGPLKVLGMDRSEAHDKGMALLSRIRLDYKADEHPDRLSDDQQQRVAIVHALMMDLALLILDEITSALDPELVSEVLDIVRDLAANGMTMVLVTHEMGFASEVVDTVCFLQGESFTKRGPAQIFGDPQGERTKAFLKRILDAGRL